MMPSSDRPTTYRARLRQNYAAAFARYLFRRDEAALAAAYELGRHSLENGVSLLDIVQIHHKVVIELLSGIEGPQELADAAATFLVEVLATFEMTQRAFQEQRAPGHTAGPSAG
jgi:S-adenosylmethionine:diacylglycerol 3-amino-3-carboxypropyl transferase